MVSGRQPAFSVVVPTYRRPSQLRTTLWTVSRCKPLPREVVVVDGDSDPAVRRIVEEANAGGGMELARYLRSAPGGNRQRNAGIRACIGDVVVFLDDDVRVEPDLFARLAATYDDVDVVGATGRVVEPQRRRRWNRYSRLRRWLPGAGKEGTFTRYGYPIYIRDANVGRDVEYMVGCFMSARRHVLESVRFDDDLSTPGQDVDFSYRLSRHGRLRYVPEITVYHEKTGFSTRSSREYDQRLLRNSFYLFRKNFEQTPLARFQFGVFVLLLFLHRAANRDFGGLRGLAEGLAAVWRQPR